MHIYFLEPGYGTSAEDRGVMVAVGSVEVRGKCRRPRSFLLRRSNCSAMQGVYRSGSRETDNPRFMHLVNALLGYLTGSWEMKHNCT